MTSVKSTECVRMTRGLPVGVLIAMFWACLPAGAATLFLSHYDGNTGNGGLNGDYAAVNAAAQGTGGVSVSTAQAKWGAGSLLVSEMGPSAVTLNYVANGASTTVGTLEMWVKPNGWTWDQGGAGWTDWRTMVVGSIQNSSPSTGGDGVSLLFAGYPLPNYVDGIARMYENGAIIGGVSGNPTETGQEWRHVAMIWNATELRYYFNGALVATDTNANIGSRSIDPFTRLVIGNDNILNGLANADAYLDDVRLSDNEVYTGASYTVPTGPFAVPEPAALGLLALGLFGLVSRRAGK